MNRMRWNLVLAAVVASGVVGCAQCDTCDDFPLPCTGPNCGHNHPPMAVGAPMTAGPVSGSMMGAPGMAPTGGDDVGPAPAMPSPNTPPATPMDPANPS